jgi:hypothetical protein
MTTQPQTLQPPATQPQDPPPFKIELIDHQELATRLNLPVTWIQDGTRSRTTDPIPCGRFGKYVLFRWGSQDLVDWIDRHFQARSSRRPRYRTAQKVGNQ